MENRRFLKKIPKLELPCYPKIPLLNICSKEMESFYQIPVLS
jgi:hypothetical protein